MPKKINLVNMSARYLVNFLATQGWAKDLGDIYSGGELLAVVLPRFLDDPEQSGSVTVKPEYPAHIEIMVPQAPAPRVLLQDGSPDWSRMTPIEIEDYRQKMVQHNKVFYTWCRTAVPEFELSDEQLRVCQTVIRYYAPRTEEEKAKDREKGIQRGEIPVNEFAFNLIGELNLKLKS